VNSSLEISWTSSDTKGVTARGFPGGFPWGFPWGFHGNAIRSIRNNNDFMLNEDVMGIYSTTS